MCKDIYEYNRFKNKLSKHEVTIGAWQMQPSTLTTATMCLIGCFDWLVVDLEHNSILWADAENIF